MGISEKFTLKGKVALVTGASYGIGYAIASDLQILALRLFSVILSRSLLIRVWLHIELTVSTLRVMFAT